MLVVITYDAEDNIRFYQLGNNHKNKVEHVGIKKSIDLEGPLIL